MWAVQTIVGLPFGIKPPRLAKSNALPQPAAGYSDELFASNQSRQDTAAESHDSLRVARKKYK